MKVENAVGDVKKCRALEILMVQALGFKRVFPGLW